MEEQTVSTEQPTSTEQQSTGQTLEQVYQQYPVEQSASEFKPQATPAAEQRLGAEIPDPILDSAGFKAYLAKQGSEIQKEIADAKQLKQHLTLQEQQRREDSDIKSAVATVKEKIGDDHIDDDFIEVALGQKARKDQKFAALYQNRNKNPAAWQAALSAVSQEFKGKYAYRQDSQLTENVRAAKQSTQTSQTAKESSSDNPIERRLNEAKSPAEFDRIWGQIRGDGF